jgi:hypothetical protein
MGSDGIRPPRTPDPHGRQSGAARPSGGCFAFDYSACESGRRTPSPAIAERILAELRRQHSRCTGTAGRCSSWPESTASQCQRVRLPCPWEEGPTNYVDLLLDGKGITLFDIADVKQDASELLIGIKVNVIVSGGIGASTDRIVAEAVPL